MPHQDRLLPAELIEHCHRVGGLLLQIVFAGGAPAGLAKAALIHRRDLSVDRKAGRRPDPIVRKVGHSVDDQDRCPAWPAEGTEVNSHIA